MLSLYSNQVWITWHQGHSYCVHGSGRSEVPWEWGPDKTKIHGTVRKQTVPCPALYKQMVFTCLARPAVLGCKLCCFPNTQNIHPIHLVTGHPNFLQLRQCLHYTNMEILQSIIIKQKVRMVPWDQEWILLSCNSLCWLQLSPLTCPYRTCCFHK